MSHHIPHKAVGKLIVATDDSQLPALETLKNKGTTNGIKDLKHLSQKELSTLEPHIQGVGALYSPSTGIVDSHGFMLSLQGEIEKKGALLQKNIEAILDTA